MHYRLTPILVTPFLIELCVPGMNATIDDEWGDELTGMVPIFTPGYEWAQGAECGGCQLKPNASRAFDHTWHDSTWDPILRPIPPTVQLLLNGTMPFPASSLDFIDFPSSGTAIYVFCIQGNLIWWNEHAVVETRMNLSFTLDGEPAGQYLHIPNNKSSDFEFNVLTYSNASLAPLAQGQAHNLMIQSHAVHLFDYAIYTWVESRLLPAADTESSFRTPDEDDTSILSSTTPPLDSTLISNKVTCVVTASPHNSLRQPLSSSSSAVSAANAPSTMPVDSIVEVTVGTSSGLLVLGMLLLIYRRRVKTTPHDYRITQHIKPFNVFRPPEQLQGFVLPSSLSHSCTLDCVSLSLPKGKEGLTMQKAMQVIQAPPSVEQASSFSLDLQRDGEDENLQ